MHIQGYKALVYFFEGVHTNIYALALRNIFFLSTVCFIDCIQYHGRSKQLQVNSLTLEKNGLKSNHSLTLGGAEHSGVMKGC